MSEETYSKVVFQEISRRHHTQIPNIVLELMFAGVISATEYALYSTYRKHAGEDGTCWIGTRKLAEMMGVSTPTITKSKKNLSRKFDELGGKSLIHVRKCNHVEQEADNVTIIDVWPENDRFYREGKNFKKSLTCEKIRHGGVKKYDTGVCKNTIRKKNTNKKNTNKNNEIETVEIVHNFCDAPSSSSIPASPSPAEGSFPLCNASRESKSEPVPEVDVLNPSPELIELLEMEPLYLPTFPSKIIARWCLKFGPIAVLETIRLFFFTRDTQKKPIEKPEAWMEVALRDKFAIKNKVINSNKEYAEQMKKKHNLKNLKINKRYCIDTSTGKDAYYNLPESQFKEIIINMTKLE